MNKKDITGKTYGKLTAIEPIKGGKFWLCQCGCGAQTRASRWHLEKGGRKSCGCIRSKPIEQEIECRKCGETKKRDAFYLRKNGHLHSKVCKQCHSAAMTLRSKQKHLEAREQCLAFYGGDPPSCACCGETIKEFLQFDHSFGDGAEHRKILGNLPICRWLVKEGFPEDIGIRVLCANCNASIGFYGYCPHQDK